MTNDGPVGQADNTTTTEDVAVVSGNNRLSAAESDDTCDGDAAAPAADKDEDTEDVIAPHSVADDGADCVAAGVAVGSGDDLNRGAGRRGMPLSRGVCLWFRVEI